MEILYKYIKAIKIHFEGISDLDNQEDFIFYLVNWDKNKRNIKKALEEVKELEDDDNI